MTATIFDALSRIPKLVKNIATRSPCTARPDNLNTKAVIDLLQYAPPHRRDRAMRWTIRGIPTYIDETKIDFSRGICDNGPSFWDPRGLLKTLKITVEELDKQILLGPFPILQKNPTWGGKPVIFHKTHVVPKKDDPFGRVIRDCTESTLNAGIQRFHTKDKMVTTKQIVRKLNVAYRFLIDDIKAAYRQDKTDPLFFFPFLEM